MATATKTFVYLSDLESWAFTSGGYATGQWDSLNGNPVGSVETRWDGNAYGDTSYWLWTGTWEDLGVSVGETVTDIRVNALDTMVTKFSKTNSVDLGPIILRNSSGSPGPTLWAGRTATDTDGTWVAEGAQSDQTVPSDIEDSDTSIQIYFELSADLQASQAADAIALFDNLSIIVTHSAGQIIVDNPITISDTNADHEFSKVAINAIAVSDTNSDGYVSFEAPNPQSASVTNADSVFVRSSTPAETVSITESDLNSVFIRTSTTLSDTGGLHKYLKILKDLTISVTESAFELAWIYFAGDAISDTGGDHAFLWIIDNPVTVSDGANVDPTVQITTGAITPDPTSSDTGGDHSNQIFYVPSASASVTGDDHKRTISSNNVTTVSETGSDFYRTTTVDNPSTGSVTGGDSTSLLTYSLVTVSTTGGNSSLLTLVTPTPTVSVTESSSILHIVRYGFTTASDTNSDIAPIRVVVNSTTVSETGGAETILPFYIGTTISVTGSSLQPLAIYPQPTISNTGSAENTLLVGTSTSQSITGSDETVRKIVQNPVSASVSESVHGFVYVVGGTSASVTGGLLGSIAIITSPTVSETAGEVGSVQIVGGAITPNPTISDTGDDHAFYHVIEPDPTASDSESDFNPYELFSGTTASITGSDISGDSGMFWRKVDVSAYGAYVEAQEKALRIAQSGAYIEVEGRLVWVSQAFAYIEVEIVGITPDPTASITGGQDPTVVQGEGRITQAPVEVVFIPDIRPARVTQTPVEVVFVPTVKPTRITQAVIEVVVKSGVYRPDPTVSVTEGNNIYLVPPPTISETGGDRLLEVAVTQVVTEMLRRGDPEAIVTQAVAEILRQNPNPEAVVTQLVVEYILKDQLPIPPPTVSETGSDIGGVGPFARITQEVVEVLKKLDPPARITQTVVEVLKKVSLEDILIDNPITASETNGADWTYGLYFGQDVPAASITESDGRADKSQYPAANASITESNIKKTKVINNPTTISDVPPGQLKKWFVMDNAIADDTVTESAGPEVVIAISPDPTVSETNGDENVFFTVTKTTTSDTGGDEDIFVVATGVTISESTAVTGETRFVGTGTGYSNTGDDFGGLTFVMNAPANGSITEGFDWTYGLYFGGASGSVTDSEIITLKSFNDVEETASVTEGAGKTLIVFVLASTVSETAGEVGQVYVFWLLIPPETISETNGSLSAIIVVVPNAITVSETGGHAHSVVIYYMPTESVSVTGGPIGWAGMALHDLVDFEVEIERTMDFDLEITKVMDFDLEVTTSMDFEVEL